MMCRGGNAQSVQEFNELFALLDPLVEEYCSRAPHSTAEQPAHELSACNGGVQHLLTLLDSTLIGANKPVLCGVVDLLKLAKEVWAFHHLGSIHDDIDSFETFFAARQEKLTATMRSRLGVSAHA